jgi:hypothetical protein
MSWAKRLGVIKVRSNYWSDDHRFVLYHCAQRIARQFPLLIDSLDELANEGWLHYLRYRKELHPGDVKSCMSVMFKYVREFYLKQEQIKSIEALEATNEMPEISVMEFDNFQDLYNHYFEFVPAVRHYRKIFELKFKGSKSDAQIGKEVGLTRQAVSWDIRRIVRDIRKIG